MFSSFFGFQFGEDESLLCPPERTSDELLAVRSAVVANAIILLIADNGI